MYSINFVSLTVYSNSLYLLTTISQRLMVSAESGAMMSELDQTLKKALVCVRRLFDSFTVYIHCTYGIVVRIFAS